jgi:hypothetical protein
MFGGIDMDTKEAIELLIRENIGDDGTGDLHGVDAVAFYLADIIDGKAKQIKKLRSKIKKLEKV